MSDWADLFKRYVTHVAQMEGTAFLDDLEVTPDEAADLSSLLGPEWRHLWWSQTAGDWR